MLYYNEETILLNLCKCAKKLEATVSEVISIRKDRSKCESGRRLIIMREILLPYNLLEQKGIFYVKKFTFKNNKMR